MSCTVENSNSQIQMLNEEFTFPLTGLSTPPFTLNGQPFTTRPESVKGVTEKRRTPGADINPASRTYLQEDNYYTVRLDTRNIIGNTLSGSTLRANDKSYSLQFIAIHRNIWYSAQTNTKPQISLFFMTPDTSMVYHICIPIEYTTVSKDENTFLKFWLYQNPPENLPAGFTLNQILNFRTPIAQFVELNYCLNYYDSITSYTLCLFNTPLKVNKTELPSWLQNDLNFSDDVSIPAENEQREYQRKTFDQILNLMLPGKFQKYADVTTKKVDPYLINDTSFFSRTGSNNVVKPTYYTVDTISLTGKLLTRQKKEGQRTLNNLKCYPIDILSQIDPKTGEIIIDEDTNKPIDPTPTLAQTEEESLEASKKTKETKDWWTYMIVMGVILGIMVILILTIVLYVMGGKTTAVREVVTVPMPFVPAAAPPTTA